MARDPAGRASARADAPADADLDVAWVGHSTVDIRIGGIRVVTDPVLRDRVGHLRRRRGTPAIGAAPVDAVLISHLHHDHLDLASLRRLPGSPVVVMPRGGGHLVARSARGAIVEMLPGEVTDVGGVRITAVPADHHTGRFGRRARAAPLGYLIEHFERIVYFPGDTDLHPVMADLPSPDLALLPIWGWGHTIGSGHLDPRRAAQAAALVRAAAVLPVHWGTFAPVRPLAGSLRRRPDGTPPWFDDPASAFRAAMRREAPDTTVHLVLPDSARHRIGDGDAPTDARLDSRLT